MEKPIALPRVAFIEEAAPAIPSHQKKNKLPSIQ
jgi:hypothetical protein